MHDILLKDFQPINHWVLGERGPRFWDVLDIPQFIIDQSTGRKYLNESANVVRFKCFLLTLGTPFAHAVASLVNVADRIVKLITLSHLRSHGVTMQAAREASIDALLIFMTPISYLSLELAACYGMLSPYDGRKLYASIERAQYGHFILAPCFQPEPTRHAFGGNINQRDVL
ncbi:MAG: hypothetical protein LW832_10245 [Parachlamydia sp.]|jgi:hypothetical protein|nr:hypothetical protein [Parachlamydia sp.]